MWLKCLRIQRLRNLEDVSLEPAEGLNIVSGPNASGKTAVLEAVYLLARGRSFRTSRIRELVQHDNEQMQIVGWLQAMPARQIAVGLERLRGQTRLRYDGANVRNLSEHARRLPLVLITPDSHGVINGRPAQRRRWLDWAMFHVEPGYLSCWQYNYHALRQRNALLKRGAPSAELSSWEETLALYSGRLDAWRAAFIGKLSLEFKGLVSELLSGEGVIGYLPGQDATMDYRELLATTRAGDRERGFTRMGPHRSDLSFQYQAMDARAILSRGQSKLYVAALMLAYARLLAAEGLQPLILVDDLPAELDEQARQRFMLALAATASQTFITAIDPELPPPGNWAAIRRFHVEHDCRVEVIQ